MAYSPYFRRGDEVEVTSPDHSMRGALFPATVVGPAAASEGNKLVVEYKTLLVNAHGGVRSLKEPVDAVMLRPAPPPERSRAFSLSDEVDAFFSGGWWEGVVTRVLERSRYTVFFRFAKQQFEFGEEELRLHREWAKRTWVPPLDGKVEEENLSRVTQADSGTKWTNEFREGTVVEVTSDEDGYQGAWFSATVVRVGKEKTLIKYQSLRTDDDTGFLAEEIATQFVRPYPPKDVVVHGFTLNDEVDAWYNDGWWEGVVSKVLRGSKYRVYFRGTDDELEFPQSKLRRHQDWINGKWVLASKGSKF